jgi:hypothetical protein
MNKIKAILLTAGIIVLVLVICALFVFAEYCNSGGKITEIAASVLSDYRIIDIFFVFGIIGTLIASFLNLSISKKARISDIVSMRRKGRIDNFVIYYSKISALACPDTVKAYVLNNDYSFSEKLIENYTNLNMLFDHRFQKDVELANLIEKVAKEAIAYYSSSKSDGFSEDLVSKYKEEYFKNIKEADKWLNIYIGTEWKRLKKEVLEGNPVEFEEWIKIYEESEYLFDKCDSVNLPVKSEKQFSPKWKKRL